MGAGRAPKAPRVEFGEGSPLPTQERSVPLSRFFLFFDLNMAYSGGFQGAKFKVFFITKAVKIHEECMVIEYK